MEDWKSPGCGSTEQALPGLCHTYHGMVTSFNEFLDWWEGHQASCEVNYCGSSSAMGQLEPLAIWKWYVSGFSHHWTGWSGWTHLRSSTIAGHTIEVQPPTRGRESRAHLKSSTTTGHNIEVQLPTRGRECRTHHKS